LTECRVLSEDELLIENLVLYSEHVGGRLVALNAAFVGRTFPPAGPYHVGIEKIREFAAALGYTSTDWLDGADPIAPPTFPIVATMPATRRALADPELGLDYRRVVHGAQRFVSSRPVRASDVLMVAVTIETIRPAGRHHIITTRSEVTTVEGEHVCTAYSTLVERGDVP